ncbi:MAG TPA: haloalkane dehalogenase [Acidimicrobiia bacterium]|nr:haloalkane dehalogenase [Acidimicrobiia bacterium]
MIVTTPPERFAGLPDYPFMPHHFAWDGIGIHFVDEGQVPPVVMFHGEPTWSFLYRHMIPPLVAAGFRAIAPDYPGFGKSDKPTDPGFYTYDRLVSAMTAFVDHLGLSDATAVVQDWGGPIGLGVAVQRPERFRRLSILNTGLFTGPRPPNPAFAAWRAFVTANPDLPVGMVMANAATRPWPEEVVAGYEAPFPSQEHKVGAWRLPLIVPIAAEDPGAAAMAAVHDALGRWQHPVQVLFADTDPIFSLGAGRRLAAHIPGAGELEVVAGAGHFLQEEAGPEVAERLVAFLRGRD